MSSRNKISNEARSAQGIFSTISLCLQLLSLELFCLLPFCSCKCDSVRFWKIKLPSKQLSEE